jgi:hypothetical protein
MPSLLRGGRYEHTEATERAPQGAIKKLEEQHAR